MFYIPSLCALLCGDVIFRQGIGRTDLEDGDLHTLLESIRTQVLSLPDETRLLPGHGPESTVGYERAHNPFL
jgi:glyoxylase-like metal-dependent hydrolase (beta-lactamase superfamily II)